MPTAKEPRHAAQARDRRLLEELRPQGGAAHRPQLAEELGYDSIWIPEAWAYEQFQLLTEIALATKRIKVATGIANVFSRSAGLLAMSAATLDEISEGRAILGLGTSGKLVVENFHGVPYEKPLTRLRETIGICRALWRGDRLSPELSTLFDARHFKLEMKPLRPTIPVYVASLQEKAIREIGRLRRRLGADLLALPAPGRRHRADRRGRARRRARCRARSRSRRSSAWCRSTTSPWRAA